MGIFFNKEKEKPKQHIETRYLNICELASFNELQTRVLAFETCVNLIAGAVAKCDFKTFRDGKEIKGAEWYMLNVEPNVNQNSSEFWHTVIHKLYENGEALVIDNGRRAKIEHLACVDGFNLEEPLAFQEQKYTGVRIGNTEFYKQYRESDVLHFVLNEQKIKPILDGIMAAYENLLETAKSTYAFANGVHLKDHIEMIGGVEDGEDWEKNYMNILNNQIKPFLNSNKAVLPEFEGHNYTVMDIGNAKADTRDIKEINNDIFEMTARALNIPPVLVMGNVAGTEDVTKWFLTFCIDPLLALLEEELNRKRYGAENVQKGNYIHIDSSTIMHFDAFTAAGNVEKLIGSGFETINELREAAGMARSEDPNADKLFITKNFAEMGTLEGGETK